MLKQKAEQNQSLGEALKLAVKESKEANYIHRLHSVQLVEQGHSAQQVAKWFNDDASSVARWVRHFREFGIEGLRDEQKSGRPPKLDPQQLQALKQDVNQSPAKLGYSQADSWNGKLLAKHLDEKYDLILSLRQCQRLLLQLQAS